MKRISKRQATQNQAGLAIWAALIQAERLGLNKTKDVALVVVSTLTAQGFSFVERKRK